jgi:hypothetical protein
MRKKFFCLVALPACVCLGSPVDAILPPNYCTVIASVREIIAASSGNRESAVTRMKEKRKSLGKKYVFSEISIETKTVGLIRYHPTPFVAGHNIMTTPDADGAFPAKALLKAQNFPDGQGMWIQYSIKDVVSGDKLQRHMYCEKFRHTMYCGSLPATYDVRAHFKSAME